MDIERSWWWWTLHTLCTRGTIVLVLQWKPHAHTYASCALLLSWQFAPHLCPVSMFAVRVCVCEELNSLKHRNLLQQHQCWVESKWVLCGCWGLLDLAVDSLWASEPRNCSLLPDLTLTQARLSVGFHKLVYSSCVLREDTCQQNKQTHRMKSLLAISNKVLSRKTWLD